VKQKIRSISGRIDNPSDFPDLDGERLFLQRNSSGRTPIDRNLTLQS